MAFLKTVLATILLGSDYRALSLVTHPTLSMYAKKIGADFVPSFLSPTDLQAYDRIILVHSDLIIRPDCPSLFRVVPEGWIGAYNMGQQPSPNQSQPFWFNRGVVVVDRKDLERITLGSDAAFNAGLEGFPPDRILDLGPRFNRLPSFDLASNGYSRLDFYIIHYTGLMRGLGPTVLKGLMQDDLTTWDKLKTNQYHVPRTVLARIGGGLGDQICAEPVIRELRRLHANDHLIVESHWPELWEDLRGYEIDKTVRAGDAKEYVEKEDILTYLTYANATNTIPLGGLTHSNMSSTELSSYLALTRPLPPEKRDIRLGFTRKIEETMFEKLGDIKGAFVLHPGLTWPTRTLGSQIWLEIIAGLRKRGKTVVVIGKGGEYRGPKRGGEKIGVLAFEVDEGVIDARDKLTVKKTLALLAHSTALISNDSAPIHLAGATDIHIFGLCTTKHSHFVFPYRKGTPWYKATEINLRPSCWPCGVDALRAFPEGLRVDLCKNYDEPYGCHPCAEQILEKIDGELSLGC